MDPITAAMILYDKSLRAGFPSMDLLKPSKHTTARKVHPSALGPGLCDRKAVWDIEADQPDSEIVKEVETSDLQNLDFRLGFMHQRWITEALRHNLSLHDYEVLLSSDTIEGTADILMDIADYQLAVVDIKTVKNKSLDGSAVELYPKPFHVAQVHAYCSLLKLKDGYQHVDAEPILFYVSRHDNTTLYFTWTWDEGECKVLRWDNETDELVSHWPQGWPEDLATPMAESWAAQEEYLFNSGPLPDRCGETPDEHPFMCCDIDRKKKIATPTCAFYNRCWGLTREPFSIGAHDAPRDWEQPW